MWASLGGRGPIWAAVWADLGVRSTAGRPVPDHGPASILLPAGGKGAGGKEKGAKGAWGGKAHAATLEQGTAADAFMGFLNVGAVPGYPGGRAAVAPVLLGEPALVPEGRAVAVERELLVLHRRPGSHDRERQGERGGLEHLGQRHLFAGTGPRPVPATHRHGQ